jgi:hypothetical protein
MTMAKLPFPSVTPGPLQALKKALHELHLDAGYPSTRDIARGQSFSHSTVHELFTNTKLPNRPLLECVIEVLTAHARGLDLDDQLDRFNALWKAAAAEDPG